MIQFKHPELLWALVLLLIPIIIHLFHFRRFKKTPFTNVAFLKTIKITTRKSSQLKRWLVLITRLGMLAFLILAFAQPFLPNTENFNKTSEMVIYLDNSFSMQAKGTNGSLLNEARQQLLNYLPEDQKFTLFTNNQSFVNTSKEVIKSELINLEFSNNQLSYGAAYLKGVNYFGQSNSIKNLIFISDFQEKQMTQSIAKDKQINFGVIPLTPQKTNNISIDSVYYTEGSNKKELSVSLSNHGNPVDNVAVAFYDQDQLITKASTAINDNATVAFTINDEQALNAKVDIIDDGLFYDNRLFFNIGSVERINVLSINGVEDLFLRKLFTADEFNYSGVSENELQYGEILDQNLIVINHMESIPSTLVATIIDFYELGGSVLLIPARESNLSSYNSLLKGLNQPLYSEYQQSPRKITEIVFEHPLLSDAFYSEVTNFQYPQVESYLKRSSLSNAILKLEDGNAFLSGNDRAYSFSADLTSTNSNFLNSPLIVPALYNIAKQSLRTRDLYYRIGANNTIVLKESFQSEDIVSITGKAYSNIPRQRVYGKYVEINTLEQPEKDGHYSIDFKDSTLRSISYNYQRNESRLKYMDMSYWSEFNQWSDISEALVDIKSTTDVKALWKWFAIFALVLLLLEMLILKYFK